MFSRRLKMANFTFTSRTSGLVEYMCDTNVPTITGPLFILIFILSIIGNSLLLCVVFIYENLKSITNIFILNLACSDLIFTITLPFWAVDHLHNWVFGDFVCKVITAGFAVGLYSSVILLTAMTVDRFITVVLHNWPISHGRVKKCAIGTCIAAWVISILASLSDAMKVKVESWEGKNYCYDESEDTLGQYLQVSLLFFLPFAIIIFCYSAILKTVLQGLNRRKFRTVAVLLCIVAAFFICWGPYHIMLLIKSLNTNNDCKVLKRLAVAYHICEMLAYSHCCMNPLLYMLSQKLRKHLLSLLRCEKVNRKKRERSTSLNISQQFTLQSSAV
ncbi:chemokine XC receptor 1-like [Astatotilapia calliptera]|uniref:G-protein coupled receptors family 1 profile domain-containing protein n=1 Tax=Astatotilapia calliptera TaxID=8154 RepID=A0A3P8PUH2_ASTCA|nr:chemokine XC receptor 1-like [Astatotilapia calliptera]